MKLFLLGMTLILSMPSFANCEFTSQEGKIYEATTRLEEITSQDGNYKVFRAKSFVDGYPFIKVIMVKNIDGTIPTEGELFFNQNSDLPADLSHIVPLIFTQKIRRGVVVFNKSFKNSSFRDALTSTVKLDESGEIETFNIVEVLKEPMHILPLNRTLINKISCSL